MSLKDDLARMEAEAAAASPLPWRCEPFDPGDGLEYEEPATRVVDASFDPEHEWKAVVCDNQKFYPREVSPADQRLIASASVDRPALVEMVKMLIDRLSDVDAANGWGMGMPHSLEERLWSEAKRKR